MQKTHERVPSCLSLYYRCLPSPPPLIHPKLVASEEASILSNSFLPGGLESAQSMPRKMTFSSTTPGQMSASLDATNELLHMFPTYASEVIFDG